MCLSFSAHICFLFLLAVVPGLGTLQVCHPLCHASAVSLLAELQYNIEDYQEISAQQAYSVHLKIYVSSLLPKETAIDFLNVCKNLKS